MCVPCGDFALKVPQLFLLSAQLLPAVGGEKGEKEVTAAAHCKFLFCLAAPSLPPSSASEEEEEAVKTLDRFTANGFTFIFPLLLGVNPSVFFSLFAFAFLHVATTTLSPGPPPPPAEKKSTTSLFPPLHTGFFCLFVGESRARPKKYSPSPSALLA